MIRLELKKYNKILIEKQQKIFTLSTGKNVKYEYLTREKILPSPQSWILEQVNLHILLLKKHFKNKKNWKKKSKRKSSGLN